MKKTKPVSGEVRAQVAALPVRRNSDGTLSILLVTSRTTQRWIVPKGWPMKGLDDWDAAAREAFEEAGVVGAIDRRPAGRYRYWKRIDDYFQFCSVTLYLLAVERQLETWAESTQRVSRWFSLEEAAALVDEPGLAAAILALRPAVEA